MFKEKNVGVRKNCQVFLFRIFEMLAFKVFDFDIVLWKLCVLVFKGNRIFLTIKFSVALSENI